MRSDASASAIGQAISSCWTQTRRSSRVAVPMMTCHYLLIGFAVCTLDALRLRTGASGAVPAQSSFSYFVRIGYV